MMRTARAAASNSSYSSAVTGKESAAAEAMATVGDVAAAVYTDSSGYSSMSYECPTEPSITMRIDDVYPGSITSGTNSCTGSP